MLRLPTVHRPWLIGMEHSFRCFNKYTLAAVGPVKNMGTSLSKMGPNYLKFLFGVGLQVAVEQYKFMIRSSIPYQYLGEHPVAFYHGINGANRSAFCRTHGREIGMELEVLA